VRPAPPRACLPCLDGWLVPPSRLWGAAAQNMPLEGSFPKEKSSFQFSFGPMALLPTPAN
jgi:hypothetical protein